MKKYSKIEFNISPYRLDTSDFSTVSQAARKAIEILNGLNPGNQLLSEKKEEKDYDYIRITKTFGDDKLGFIIVHQNDYVEMGAMTTSADVITVKPYGLQKSNFTIEVTRRPNSPTYNAELVLTAEVPSGLKKIFSESICAILTEGVSENFSDIRDRYSAEEAEQIIEQIRSKWRRPAHDYSDDELNGILNVAFSNLRPYGWQAAIKEAKKVLRFRFDPSALFIIGVASSALEKYAQGEAYLRESLRHLPNNYDAWYNLGLCLRMRQAFDEELACYEKALAIDPDNHCVFAQMGECLEKLNRQTDAVLAYQRALKYSPNPGGYWHYTGLDFSEQARNALTRLCVPWGENQAVMPLPSGDVNHDLLRAARQGDLLWVQSLLKQNANITTCDENGDTALHLCAKLKTGQKKEIMQLLLDQGALIDVMNKQKETPLVKAVESTNLPLIKLLLDSGANPNSFDAAGYPLLYSTWSFDVVKLLLKYGADPDMADNFYGYSSIWRAVQYENRDWILALLVSGADIDIRGKSGDTVLFYAVMQNSLVMVGLLLEKGADPNTQNTEGFCPLHIAVQRGYLSIVLKLLEYKARTDLVSLYGKDIAAFIDEGKKWHPEGEHDAILALLENWREKSK